MYHDDDCNDDGDYNDDDDDDSDDDDDNDDDDDHNDDDDNDGDNDDGEGGLGFEPRTWRRAIPALQVHIMMMMII
jgi:hypothetical protein